MRRGTRTDLFDIMRDRGRDRVTSGVIARALEKGDRLTASLIDDAVWALGIALARQVATRAGRTWSSSVLFTQEFTWTLPLPEQAAPIRIDDFLPPGHRERVHYAPGADDSTVAGNIAGARASAYGIARRYDRAIYWVVLLGADRVIALRTEIGVDADTLKRRLRRFRSIFRFERLAP